MANLYSGYFGFESIPEQETIACNKLKESSNARLMVEVSALLKYHLCESRET